MKITKLTKAAEHIIGATTLLLEIENPEDYKIHVAETFIEKAKKLIEEATKED